MASWPRSLAGPCCSVTFPAASPSPLTAQDNDILGRGQVCPVRDVETGVTCVTKQQWYVRIPPLPLSHSTNVQRLHTKVLGNAQVCEINHAQF